MRAERLLRVLADGQTALGVSVHLADPAVIEIAALAGFDWVTVALEHAPLSVRDILAMQLAADVRGTTLLVLVEQPDDPRILPLINAGVGGIVLAHATGPEAVEQLVRTVRFPPLGERGAHGAVRSADYGARPYREYVEEVDRSVAVGLIIEDRAGLENAEAILAVPGVDFAYVGLQDLAQTLGFPGETGHPAVREVIAQVAGIARGGDTYLACSLYEYEIQEMYELGVRLISTTLDYSSLLATFRADVESARAALAELSRVKT
jgi:2-keto-3-deoxy-L-rhamnonate aldolase RhmA